MTFLAEVVGWLVIIRVWLHRLHQGDLIPYGRGQE